MASGSECKCLGQSQVPQQPMYACCDIVLLRGNCSWLNLVLRAVAVINDIYRCRAWCTRQSTIQWLLAKLSLVLVQAALKRPQTLLVYACSATR